MRRRTVGTIRGSTAAANRHAARGWKTQAKIAVALASVTLLAVAAGLGVARSAEAGVSNVVGSGFTLTPGDLQFILKQIKIAEHHAATLTPANPCGTLVGPGPDQIPDALTSYGLRTVDGSCNNLLPGREKFAAADVPFPRLAGSPVFRQAEGVPAGFLGPGSPAVPSSSYAQKKGFVFDSQPRTISNLIVDQTSDNPAAVAAARSRCARRGTRLRPCTTVPTPTPPRAPGELHAGAQDAGHPERDDRRRPLAAVQLVVHVLRAVLRPRRRPDRQERRHGLRPAQGRRPAGHAWPGRHRRTRATRFRRTSASWC